MAYQIRTSYWSKEKNLSTELKFYSNNGNNNFTLEDVKYTIECWEAVYEGKLKNSIIKAENGDEMFVQVFYNGKWCKKYSNGIK